MIFDDPPNHMPRIDAIWAFLSVDEDGSEGVIAAPIAGMTVPLIAADEKRLASLRPIAASIARMTKKAIVLVRFERRVEVETVGPIA